MFEEGVADAELRAEKAEKELAEAKSEQEAYYALMKDYGELDLKLEAALASTTPSVEDGSKKWACCEVCNRMYRSGESCVDCPGFAEPVNTIGPSSPPQRRLC